MKRIIFYCLLLNCTIILAQTPPVELNKGLGIRKTFQDFNTFNHKDFDAFREYSNGMELFVQKSFSKSLNVIIPIGLITVSDSSRDLALDPTLTIGAQAQFKFLKKDNWITPFLVGGIDASIPKLKEFYLNIPLGLGVNFNIHPQVALQWQSDFRLPLVNGKTYLQHSFGIAYLLGNVRKETPKKMLEAEAMLDSDGDSIPDALDLCPSVAGLRLFMGCPDTDNDGIADKDDRCPETAGVKALRGCPDSDEDGIADSDDECPNVKGSKNNKGCPEEKAKDSDGDGVIDKNDDCPDLKGSSKTAGCPDMDGDGIADKDDACPDLAGTKSNK
ncbi:MAG: thrombospondin type 3 repeat-containing protein, partial [Saprospiraceae bacterium]